MSNTMRYAAINSLDGARAAHTFDVRTLDHVDAIDSDVTLIRDDSRVTVYVEDGSTAAREIADSLAPFTRHAVISRPDVYADAKRRIRHAANVEAAAITHLRGPLDVGLENVRVRNGIVHIGSATYKAADIFALAERGDNLFFPGGSVQAAFVVLFLAVQRNDRDDYALLQQRIAAYESGRSG